MVPVATMLPRASACGGPDCVSSNAMNGLPLESTLSIGERGEVVVGLMPAPEESPGTCSMNAVPLHRRAYRATVLPLMLTVRSSTHARYICPPLAASCGEFDPPLVLETPPPVLEPAPAATHDAPFQTAA